MKFGFCIVIQVLLYLMSTEATKLRCPDNSQWNLRFRAFCRNSTTWYYCLYDTNSQLYREVCSNQEFFHKPGFKYTISGYFNGEPCSKTRFQPFKFSMNGYSACVFLKSICTEEGQILHSNGTTKTDITCRCDYTKGYAYVKIPRNTCYCDPTREDCSCYKKSCGENEVLTADYVCIKQDEWYKENNCPVILKKRWKDNITVVSAGKIYSAMPPSSFLDVIRLKVHSQTTRFVTLIVFSVMLLIVFLFIKFGKQIVEKCHKFHNIDEIISKKVHEELANHKKKEDSNGLVQKDEDELRRDKIRAIHIQHINCWKKDDEKFIETRATHAIYEKVTTDSFVLVVGCAGNGKSSIIRHIALKLRNDDQYEIIPTVLSPCGILKFINNKLKQIFIVDDFCVKMIINVQSVNLWLSKIDEILKLIDTSDRNDSKDVKFLFATELDIYNDSIFKKLRSQPKYVFNLSEPSSWYLTEDEKSKMIKKYISQKTETIPLQNIKSDEAYFPLLCKIAERKTEDQIFKLFSNFEDFIKEDMLALKNKNNLKFCVITLCALLNNSLKKEILNEVYENDIEMRAFENICLEFNLGPNKDIVTSKIKEQLENLEDTYIEKMENDYHFINNKVYLVAVSVCGKIFLQNFIKFVRSSFIAERFCFQSNMTNNKKHLIIIDDKDVEKKYFDRLLFDLSRGDTYSTFHNSQLCSKSYRKNFISYCRIRQLKVIELLKHFSVKSETVSGTYAESDYEDYTEFTETHHFRSHKMRKPLIESAWEGYADIVQFLLECNCYIDEVDRFGRTALFAACRSGKKKVVDVLLESHANILLSDKSGQSPLLVASRERHDDIINTLLQHNADVNQCDFNGNWPLLVASSESQLSTVHILSRKMTKISKRNNLGQTPVFVASMNGREDVLKYLLTFLKEYISTSDNENRSPLFIACKEGHHNIVQLLLKNDADVSQSDWNKRSPLFIASAEGYANIATTLIKNKADINQCDDEGMTPLFIACDKGRTAVAKILVNSDADLNITDHKKRTPLYAACRRGYQDIVEFLHDKKASISDCNQWGGSPLFAACRQGHFDIVKYLVVHGANLVSQDVNGTTPLLVASENGNTEIGQFLIDKGSVVNQSDHNKRTPLHVAAVGGHVKIAEVLIHKGANTKLTDADNQTPLDLASKFGFTEIVKLLSSDN